MAVVATKGGARHAERLSKAHRDRIEKDRVEAEAVAAQLAASPLRLTVHAGEDGRLFGSVTAGDVATEISKAGVIVDRKQVRLEEPIRSVGTHEVQVHLHPEVNASVAVEVVGE